MKVVKLEPKNLNNEQFCTDEQIERKFAEVRAKIIELRDQGQHVCGMIIGIDARPLDPNKDNYYIGRFALNQMYSESVSMLAIMQQAIIKEMFQ